MEAPLKAELAEMLQVRGVSLGGGTQAAFRSHVGAYLRRQHWARLLPREGQRQPTTAFMECPQVRGLQLRVDSVSAAAATGYRSLDGQNSTNLFSQTLAAASPDLVGPCCLGGPLPLQLLVAAPAVLGLWWHHSRPCLCHHITSSAT